MYKSVTIKRILKINNSWPELFNFQNSFNFFPKPQVLDYPKGTHFAGDNFKFDESNGNVSKKSRKHCWKRRNCSLQAIFPFPTVFSKDLFCRQVKFGEGLKELQEGMDR